MNNREISERGMRDRARRLPIFAKGLKTCYVAVNNDNSPCYMQFLIKPADVSNFKPFFEGGFRPLAKDEALLEFAFTPEAYRGQRIMPWAMAQIAEKASEFGARLVITYVNQNNVPALKGCKGAGFVPFEIREDHWRLFRCHTSFAPLPDGAPYPFEVEKHESTTNPTNPINTRNKG